MDSALRDPVLSILKRRSLRCLLLTAILFSCVITQAHAQGQRPAMPKPGPVPLPILPALPRIDDSSFFAQTSVPHGSVVQANYKNFAGKDKRMHVYLPPDYEKNQSAKYPVLYLNHGGGDDDSRWTSTNVQQGGSAQNILDNLIAAGKAKSMIVVMPDTRGIATVNPQALGSDDACSQEYLKDIIPYVESHYRARPGRENRAIAGLSMGGFVVMSTGLSHLDTFGELYVYSSGYFADQLQAFENNYKSIFQDPKTNEELLRVPLYMAAGETDFALGNSQKTMAILNKYGVRNFWTLSTGGHEWANWRRYLYQTAQVMFPNDPRAESISLAPAPSGFDVRRDGVPSGKVDSVEYDSKTVGIKRQLRVYLPAGYTPDTKYPVLYLLHGIGGNEKDWTSTGKADAIMDNLIADKKSVPMIVVMPDGRASKEPPSPNPFDGNPFLDYARFEDDLLKDVIPTIEKRYSVKTERENRALAGLSMGGGQSLNFGLKNLDTFAWVGGFSSAPNTKPVSELIPNASDAAKRLRLLWVSCGDRDFILNISQDFHAALKAANMPHLWYLERGTHEWPVWKNDLYQFAQKVFQPAAQ